MVMPGVCLGLVSCVYSLVVVMVLHTKKEDLEKNETAEAGGSRFQKQADIVDWE